MTKKKAPGINPELEKFVGQLLIQVMNDPTASITDKVKVMDRALKLEALKLKDTESDWGAGFFGEDDDEDK